MTEPTKLVDELDALFAKATGGQWQFYWRVDDNKQPDCGIFTEKQKGHAVSVCRAPRYETRKQWEKNAALICRFVNSWPQLRGMAADAARYRWLRDEYTAKPFDERTALRGENLDAAVDAALAAGGSRE